MNTLSKRTLRGKENSWHRMNYVIVCLLKQFSSLKPLNVFLKGNTF